MSLVTRTFIKLSHNVCLIKTHILIYRHARCNCKLWKALWFYCVFWVLSYIIDEFSCLKYCIFTKLSQIVYLINIQIFLCQHAKCDCRLWKVFYSICVLCEFFIYPSIRLIQSNSNLLLTNRDRSTGQFGNTAQCLKNTSQEWAAFAFGSTYLHQTFIKCVST